MRTPSFTVKWHCNFSDNFDHVLTGHQDAMQELADEEDDDEDEDYEDEDEGEDEDEDDDDEDDDDEQNGQGQRVGIEIGTITRILGEQWHILQSLNTPHPSTSHWRLSIHKIAILTTVCAKRSTRRWHHESTAHGPPPPPRCWQCPL